MPRPAMIHCPSLEELKQESLTINVDICARCEGEHPSLEFVRMLRPWDRGHPYWALCPDGGGPVLLCRVPAAEPADRR